MIYVSGFCSFLENSFLSCSDQFAGNNFIKSTFKNVYCFFENETCILGFSSLNMSWNRLIICVDGDAHVFGFLDGKSGQVVNLKTPDKSKILQGCCSHSHCHLVTEAGKYWLYNFNSKEWRDLNHLLGSGQNLKTSDSLSPVSESFVYKVSCNDYMTVAVTNKGIYSVPLLLSFPQVQVLDVCCGKEHTILLTEHYSVFSWGNGSRGQLGHSELESEEQPREVSALSGLKVISVAAGGWHSCCVSEQGDLYSWGWNCSGQLGFPGEENTGDIEKTKANCVVSVLAEPRPVDWSDEQTVVEQVACGSQHTITVLKDNSVWGCGWNKYGQLLEGGVPEKVFGMTKLPIPNIVKKKVKVFCGHWTSVFVI